MKDQSKKRTNVTVIILLHMGVIVLILSVLVFSQIAGLSIFEVFKLWQLLSILTCIWVVWSWYRTKNSIFNPYGIFILAVFLFNSAPIVLMMIPGNEQARIDSIFPQHIINYSVVLITICLAALHLGALFSLRLNTKKNSGRGIEIGDRELLITGYLLTAISLYPLFLTLKESLQLSVNFGYNSIYQQPLGTGILSGPAILANFVVPGALFLLVGSGKDKTGRILSVIIIIIYTLAQLILGKRSVAIMPLIAYVWLWHKTIKPINSGILAAASGLFLFLIFPIIRMSRSFHGLSRFSLRTISDLLGSTNPFLDVFNEMGSTMQTIAHTVQLIPDYRPFDHGVSYLYALYTLLPNFFWKVHPAISHGTLGSWLISTVNPDVYKNGGSIGYSLIAEAYANFGLYGAPIAIAIIGFSFVYFSEFVERTENKAYLAAFASYFAFFLFFVRSESYAILRPLLWYALIPLFMSLFFVKWRLRISQKI